MRAPLLPFSTRGALHPRQSNTGCQINFPKPHPTPLPPLHPSSSTRRNLSPVIFCSVSLDRPTCCWIPHLPEGDGLSRASRCDGDGRSGFFLAAGSKRRACFPSRVSVCSRAAVCQHALMLRGPTRRWPSLPARFSPVAEPEMFLWSDHRVRSLLT